MLRESIKELSEEEIRFKPGKAKWSIHQTIIHRDRLKKVLSEPDPLLTSPDQNAWANSLREQNHLANYKKSKQNQNI